jgi:hypothetical protein
MRSVSTGIAGALEDLRRHAAGDLKDLRRNWGSAYEITGAPGWRAVRRDSQVALIASSPRRLRDLITADYAARPVPRSCPGPQARPAGVTECGAGAQTGDADSAPATAREGLSNRPTPPPPPPAVPQPHPLMTPAEVASVFQVDPRTIWRWEQAGDLGCIRLPSGVRRYFRAQVDAFIRGEKLTPERVRAVRDELTALIKGRPAGNAAGRG